MEHFHSTSAFQALCKARGQWGLYISFYVPEDTGPGELSEACTFLNFDEHHQIIVNGEGFFLFDSEAECKRHFNLCVGDDGPTELNPYRGKIHVYALTCDNKGNLRNENT